MKRDLSFRYGEEVIDGELTSLLPGDVFVVYVPEIWTAQHIQQFYGWLKLKPSLVEIEVLMLPACRPTRLVRAAVGSTFLCWARLKSLVRRFVLRTELRRGNDGAYRRGKG